jgi:hypothetical protein
MTGGGTLRRYDARAAAADGFTPPRVSRYIAIAGLPVSGAHVSAWPAGQPALPQSEQKHPKASKSIQKQGCRVENRVKLFWELTRKRLHASIFSPPTSCTAGSHRSMFSAAIAAALTVYLLLLEAPGGAVAQGAPGRGGGNNNVLKRSKPSPTPADLDRSILLEWRASSPPLQRVWSDENAPASAWDGVNIGAGGRVVDIELREQKLTGVVPAALGVLTALKAGAYTRSQVSST